MDETIETTNNLIEANAVAFTKDIVEDGMNGQIEEVMIAPVGQFVGSDKDGNPVEQNFTEEALREIADDLNETGEEVLLDKDHASAREGLNRDTQSLGWFSRFFVKPLKGLFGLLKLTKTGREMIENREYRHLSPVFAMGGEGNTPTKLVSVAATNTPALKVPDNVILNTESNKTEEIEMTKEEIVELIKETIKGLKDEENETEKVEEVVEEKKEEIVDACSTEEVKNECGEGEVKNETPVAEEKDDEEKKEEKVEEKKEKKAEVIKEEVLNQAPTTNIPSADPEWKNLKGKEFMDWCQKHPELCR